MICSLSGWGQDGPYAARAGHDLTYQALAGALAHDRRDAGRAARRPGRRLERGHRHARRPARAGATGRGEHIDAALYDAGLHANLIGWAAEAGGAQAVGEPLPLTGALPCYNLYRPPTARWLALGALEPHFWQRFCDAAGRQD